MKTNGLRALKGTLSPNCQQATRLQSETLDRPLPFWERTGLRLHLVLCKWCRRYGRQLRLIRVLAGQSQELGQSPGPELLSPQAKERMKETLRPR